MKVLIVDMTHGGVKLSLEFAKNPKNEVFAWDIYNTLEENEKRVLMEAGTELVSEDYIKETFFKENKSNEDDLGCNTDLKVVAPVHCNQPFPVSMTHHQAVAYLLENRIKVPIIEITGVKGKTTTAAILKEIYRDLNLLVLSSLGVDIINDGKEEKLLKNISITPASIITAWEFVERRYNVDICIFETSLGGTGMADVGVLTNLAEDYSLAGGMRSASQAKSQIFASKMVVCDYQAYHSSYSDIYSLPDKINTFSVDKNSNLRAYDTEYSLHNTKFLAKADNLLTVDGLSLSTDFEVSTFAPAQHHIENALSAICAALTMGADVDIIVNGLKNFKGLPGRTSVENQGESKIIQEINPGINVTAVQRAVEMIKDYTKPALVLGGSYGVTCEEIDEKSLSAFLNTIRRNVPIILTGELGKSIQSRLNSNTAHYDEIKQAVEAARKNGARNILLVYRSNFKDLKRR